MLNKPRLLTEPQLEQAWRLRRAAFSMKSIARMYGLTIKELKEELSR